ncbi:XRE family transcriptional regulator [Duganella sp. HH101]|uniref:XRE family transcriptional regulator n=1 Tax=Duganella sp. HH101 TaxID=1781066 RepID=UPI0008743DF6|nr:XRE family transcriptional regulator [Duganella sp. HH101]OFA00302.1 antitoxin HipB [Duganella sp. HH101]
MGRNLDDVIKGLPADRQKKIAALSQKKIEEMIAHAATLTDFRKAVGKTQAEVAKELGINQNAVSQLEKRSETYVSTLRRFLKSLGLTLELSVLDKNGMRIDLQNFLQWSDNSNEDAAEATTPSAKKNAARKRTTRAKKAGA